MPSHQESKRPTQPGEGPTWHCLPGGGRRQAGLYPRRQTPRAWGTPYPSNTHRGHRPLLDPWVVQNGTALPGRACAQALPRSRCQKKHSVPQACRRVLSLGGRHHRQKWAKVPPPSRQPRGSGSRRQRAGAAAATPRWGSSSDAAPAAWPGVAAPAPRTARACHSPSCATNTGGAQALAGCQLVTTGVQCSADRGGQAPRLGITQSRHTRAARPGARPAAVWYK